MTKQTTQLELALTTLGILDQAILGLINLRHTNSIARPTRSHLFEVSTLRDQFSGVRLVALASSSIYKLAQDWRLVLHDMDRPKPKLTRWQKNERAYTILSLTAATAALFLIFSKKRSLTPPAARFSEMQASY